MKNLSQPVKFWKLAVAQIVLAVGASAIFFYLKTEAFLAGPPSGDLYANTWGFQLFVYFLVWLPGVLLITGCVLAIEHAVLTRNALSESQRAP